MSEVYFYHLTRHTLEEALPTLLGLARKAGWRVAIRGLSAERLDWIDGKLWEGDGFLAHGLEGGPYDGDQPILLTQGAARNAPDCLISIDGAELREDEITSLKRAMVLFDGNDGDALNRARDQWKDLTSGALTAKYWSTCSAVVTRWSP